jgi:hypothetical protein
LKKVDRERVTLQEAEEKAARKDEELDKQKEQVAAVNGSLTAQSTKLSKTKEDLKRADKAESDRHSSSQLESFKSEVKCQVDLSTTQCKDLDRPHSDAHPQGKTASHPKN